MFNFQGTIIDAHLYIWRSIMRTGRVSQVQDNRGTDEKTWKKLVFYNRNLYFLQFSPNKIWNPIQNDQSKKQTNNSKKKIWLPPDSIQGPLAFQSDALTTEPSRQLVSETDFTCIYIENTWNF